MREPSQISHTKSHSSVETTTVPPKRYQPSYHVSWTLPADRPRTPQIQVFGGRWGILTTGGRGGKVIGVMCILRPGVMSPLRRGKAGGSLMSPLRRGKAGGSVKEGT